VRKFLVAIALLIGVMFIIGRLAELQAIGETLQRGDLRYIALAFFVELIWLLNTAASYRAIYHALDIREDIRHLTILSTAAFFINVVAPSAGIGGVAVFVSESRRRGYSAARATLGSVLFVLFEYAGFLSVLVLGLIVLIRRNNLQLSEIIASGVFIIIGLILAILLYLGLRSAADLGNALAWMAKQTNRFFRPFIKRPYLSETRAHEFAKDAAEGLAELRQKPDDLLLAMSLALSSKALLVSILFLVFLAFKVPFSPGTLIAGYSIAQLFTIVSPTPAGVGIVEGVMTLGLNSLNVPLGAAAVITLLYRGLTFWVPLILGLIAFRTLARQPESESEAGKHRPSP
jgi:uncharacterized protein (TIRG00374 family)